MQYSDISKFSFTLYKINFILNSKQDHHYSVISTHDFGEISGYSDRVRITPKFQSYLRSLSRRSQITKIYEKVILWGEVTFENASGKITLRKNWKCLLKNHFEEELENLILPGRTDPRWQYDHFLGNWAKVLLGHW